MGRQTNIEYTSSVYSIQSVDLFHEKKYFSGSKDYDTREKPGSILNKRNKTKTKNQINKSLNNSFNFL